MAQVASKFGRYEIKGEVGRGGMATVYKAYDPTFQREVAIKVLPAEFTHDPQFRERFMREARLVALLEHPAIVPVYDFGEQDNQPYIVMRFMGGGSLADRINKGPLSVPSVVQILNILAPALDAAHSRGIVHRDLKPGNILFDDYGNPFISDFGIARITQSASSFTLTGNAIIGTPAYMSPEQIQGDKDLDGRSDIYALGVILFQMLTGSMPYHSDTPAKVMMQHLLDPIPSPRAAKADVPPMFDAVISHAMAKDRTQRFAKASEMATLVQKAGKASMPSDSMPAPRNESATVLAPEQRPRPSTQAPLVGAPPLAGGGSQPAGIPQAATPVTGTRAPVTPLPPPPQTSTHGARPVTAATQKPAGGMSTVAGGPPSGVYPAPGGPATGTHLPPPPPPGGRAASGGPEAIGFGGSAPQTKKRNRNLAWILGGGGLLILLGLLALGAILIFSFLPKSNAGTGPGNGPALTFVPTPSVTGGVPVAGQTAAGSNAEATTTALFQSTQDALFTATAIQAITDTGVAGLNAAATAGAGTATAEGATAEAATANAQATADAETAIVATQTANANATATMKAGLQATNAIIATYMATHTTATAAALATAHVQQTLQAKAVLMGQFTHNWVSTDPNGGMTRLNISKVNDNTVSFHGFGSCTPTDCDWGSINVSFTPPVLSGTWSFSFKTTKITVKLSGNNLSATTVDTYNDGRATQTHTYTMTH